MRKAIIPLVLLTALSGCHVLFPEDPRDGAEPAAECAARVEKLLGPTNSYRTYEGTSGTPIFTFDITKLAFEDMQALIVPGSDETAGARLRDATNEESTAVDAFMNLRVDTKGAFFLARDPALYRVRGAEEPLETMIATGCSRQEVGMRLIMVDVLSAPPPEPELETESSEDNSSQTESD